MRRRAERLVESVEERPQVFGAIAAGAIIVALVAVFAGIPGLSGGSGTEIRAAFGPGTTIASAYQLGSDQSLIQGAPVRVHGVTVGHVTDSKLDRGGRQTIITMRVKGVDIHADASAHLAFRTLLGGNLQVKLDPGSLSAPKLTGAIPASRTGDQVAFDDLFDPFQPTTRRAARQTFSGLQQAFADPDATGRAFDTLGSTTKTIGRGLPALQGTQAGDLARLVRSASRVTAPLAADRDQLSALIDDAERALAVTDQRRAALATSLAVAPSMLNATDRAVGELDPTLDELDPLAQQLRPGARQLAPTLRPARGALIQANALLRDARPLLRDAAPTFVRLRRLAGNAIPLIRALSPTVARLNADILPWLNSRDPETKLKVYEAIGPFFSTANSSASGFDDDGYFFYFPDEPDVRTLGANPCSVDLTEPQRVQCKSLVDVLRDIFPANRKRK